MPKLVTDRLPLVPITLDAIEAVIAKNRRGA